MTEEIKKPIIKRKVKTIKQSKIEVVDNRIICNHKDCEEKECSHYVLHDKMKTACDMACGVHPEAKCI